MAAVRKTSRRSNKNRNSPQVSTNPILIEVERRGSTYHIHDPQLDILVKNRDLATGYDELNRLRIMVLEKLTGAGMSVPRVRAAAPETAVPAVAAPWRLSGGGIVMLVAGALAALLLFVFVVTPLLGAMKTVVRGVERLSELSTPGAPARLASNSIASFAGSLQQISPERREEVRRNLRIIARELRPYMVEIAPMFEPLSQRPAGNGTAPRGSGPAKEN